MVDTNEQYGVVQNFFGVGSSPFVLGNQLIVMVGGSPPEDQSIAPMRLDRVSPNGSAVVAFDRMTGEERWKCGDDLASYSSPRPIDIDGKTLVLVFAREGLMGIDPELGKVLWRFDHRARILESVNAMVPVVVDDNVLISECYEVGSVLLKVSFDQAEIVWQDPANRRVQSLRAHWATPIVIDGNLYGCSGRNAPDSDFRCIDFRSGEVKWIDPRRIRSSVTRVGDHLLVLEERGRLQVVEPSPQELKVVAEWDLAVPDGDRPAISYPCWAAPIVVDDRLILRGTSQVLCLKLAR
jgi:outer membrane protein assembly factor BamB